MTDCALPSRVAVVAVPFARVVRFVIENMRYDCDASM
jgi:hypothetical protein